jgi:hypothetical protein
MGSITNQSHEFGAIVDLFKKKKGIYQLIQDKLNNLRNTFTFVSNFVVLGMGVLIFKFMTDRIW